MFCISHTILPHKSKAASSFSTLAASSVSYHLNSSEGKSTAIRAVFHPNFIDQKLLIAPGGGRGGGGAKKNLVPKIECDLWWSMLNLHRTLVHEFLFHSCSAFHTRFCRISQKLPLLFPHWLHQVCHII